MDITKWWVLSFALCAGIGALLGSIIFKNVGLGVGIYLYFRHMMNGQRSNKKMCDSSSNRDITYELEGQIFIWDKFKAESNKEKHGISFEDAATVFIIDGAEEFEDEEHSDDEERLIVIGLSKELRILTVVHCWRENETVIRIISARKATKLEQKLWMR